MAREIIWVENAEIFYRNFAGADPNGYNANRKRTFALKLTPEQAEEFRAQGYNVKTRRSDNPDYLPTDYIQIEVSYKIAAPAIYVYMGNREIMLDEETVKGLDNYELESVDVAFRPSHWEYMGRSGEKAYLTELRAVVKQNPWDKKYAHYTENSSNQEDTDMPF
jgi:hypothetical protein